MTVPSTLGEVRPEHDRGTGSDLVLLYYVRGLALPCLDVWAHLTERAQLSAWLGTVDGDRHADELVITAHDGPSSKPMTVHAQSCSSPHAMTLTVDGGVLEVRLTQVGVVTTLELVRRHLRPDEAAAAGPWWQYVLDRLEAHIDGRSQPAWSGYTTLLDQYPCPR